MIRPEVTEQLEVVFKKLVGKKVENRYQSMTEVITELERSTVGPTTSVTQQPRPPLSMLVRSARLLAEIVRNSIPQEVLIRLLLRPKYAFSSRSSKKNKNLALSLPTPGVVNLRQELPQNCQEDETWPHPLLQIPLQCQRL
jgi:hypothetical protein